jgi:hypothetical protein
MVFPRKDLKAVAKNNKIIYSLSKICMLTEENSSVFNKIPVSDFCSHCILKIESNNFLIMMQNSVSPSDNDAQTKMF